jgi:NRPS condensation-like uncharacterized protein
MCLPRLGGLVFLQTLLPNIAPALGAKSRRSERFSMFGADQTAEAEAALQPIPNLTQSRREPKAYHSSGTDERGGFVHIITGSMDSDVVLQKAREKGVTITEYLTAVMILSVDAIQRRQVTHVHRFKPVKISVPINLRNVFPSHTLRNFANYVNPGIDPRLGEYTFDEVLNLVHHFMAMEVTKKLLNVKITTNVRTEQNRVLRLMPLFIKNMAMKYVYSQVGDVLSSTTLSNLGVTKLPEEMSQYVRRMDFILGPLASNRVCAAALTYNGRLRINFTAPLPSAAEREFLYAACQTGHPREVESNQME